jgi:hypothetical protein
MALIFEDESKTIGKKQFVVPDKIVDKLKLNRNLFDKYKTSKGFKRINAIIDDDYNKRSNKKDKVHNGDKTISGSDLKKLNQEKDSGEISNNPNDINNVLTGPLFPWAKDQLRAARTAVEKVKAVPPVPKLEKNPEKIADVNKPLKMGNATVRITESTDKDWPIYYDYLTDYDAYYVLSEFFNNPQGKQNWGVLINPDMYKKALSEFTKYGKLINFPSKYVYQWMGIIMKNTAILRANTELAGHSSQFPGYEVAEFAENIDGIEIEPDYGEGSEWLEEKGLYDWMQMPDGSDAWSDYGLDPLEIIFAEYNEDLPPEKVLVLVNKALDVYHQRGDMASIFIQGGSKELSHISESIKRNNKKIIVNENQLLVLKEYHNQLVFNFDKEGNPYYKKDNWQNYVDFLEEIGYYGTLPASEWSRDDIMMAVEKQKEEIDPNDDDIQESDMNEAFCTVICNAYLNDELEDVIEIDYLPIFENFEQFKENSEYNNIHEIMYSFLLTKDIIGNIDDYPDILCYSAYREYQKLIKEAFFKNMNYYGFPQGLVTDDRGLVYIERNIIIPTFDSPDFNDMNYNDYYAYLKNFYSDLGNCFSWDKDCGEAYCGNSFSVGRSEIKLKCWIDPKDVDWNETVYRNCYSLNEEREIYIDKKGAKIEVFDIVMVNGNLRGKSLINKPIIIQY